MNGNTVTQKYYYYLMFLKGGSSEMIGFHDFKWLEFSDAVKNASIKREKEMLRSAREVLKEWESTHKLK